MFEHLKKFEPFIHQAGTVYRLQQLRRLDENRNPELDAINGWTPEYVQWKRETFFGSDLRVFVQDEDGDDDDEDGDDEDD